MSTLAAIVAAGDPVDPDLVSLLDAEGLDTLDAIHALGRAHWIAFFADRAGFSRDFVEMPEACGPSPSPRDKAAVEARVILAQRWMPAKSRDSGAAQIEASIPIRASATDGGEPQHRRGAPWDARLARDRV